MAVKSFDKFLNETGTVLIKADGIHSQTIKACRAIAIWSCPSFSGGQIEVPVDPRVDGCIEALRCSDNHLVELRLTDDLPCLETVDCSHNQLKELSLSVPPEHSGVKNLKSLVCSYNEMSKLDLMFLGNLSDIDCSHNNLTSLRLSRHTKLRRINCSHNRLQVLDLSGIVALEHLNAQANRFSDPPVNE